ncbi:MAG: hypothetical protein VX075_07940, partial [Pseudomonadota bacterium]|nr:hypothetical protein [Pseudomonadota bacterium]
MIGAAGSVVGGMKDIRLGAGSGLGAGTGGCGRGGKGGLAGALPPSPRIVFGRSPDGMPPDPPPSGVRHMFEPHMLEIENPAAKAGRDTVALRATIII